MWTKPWTFKEGFLIGGGLIFAGLMLELSVGPVVWEAFAWPANGIVLARFFVLLTVMVYLRKKVYAFQWMTTYQAAIPAMVYAVVLTIIMGVTHQQVNSTWINNMLSFWPLVLIYVYIAVILGLTIHRRLREIFRGQGSMKRDIPFMLNHLGLFIALTTATLGNADMQRLNIFAYTLLGVAVVIAWWKLADDLVYVSLAFLTIACFSEHFGPRKPGATTGLGTQRKRGQLSPGLPISSISTTANYLAIANVWPLECSSAPSSSCKCVGWALTTCHQSKVRAYTPIA